jgi:lipopolysaccharide assembly protein A
MRLLTFVFYVGLGVLLAWFAARNWTMVSLRLWDGYELSIRLPLLMLLAFLLGVVPLGILQNLSRWRLRHKVRKLERALADTQPAAATAPAANPSPNPAPARPPAAGL